MFVATPCMIHQLSGDHVIITYRYKYKKIYQLNNKRLRYKLYYTVITQIYKNSMIYNLFKQYLIVKLNNLYNLLIVKYFWILTLL